MQQFREKKEQRALVNNLFNQKILSKKAEEEVDLNEKGKCGNYKIFIMIKKLNTNKTL